MLVNLKSFSLAMSLCLLACFHQQEAQAGGFSGMVESGGAFNVALPASPEASLFRLTADDGPRSGIPSRRDRFYGIQHSFFGFHIGSIHMFTDLSGKPGDGTLNAVDFLFNDPGVSAGLFYRYRLSDWFAVGVDVSLASVEGLRRTEVVPEELHSFRTRLGELCLRTEYFWPNLEWSPWDVYAFTGIVLYIQDTNHSGPAGSGPESINKPDIVNPHLAIPLGAGVTFAISSRLRVGYEFSYRYSGNHSLDGIYVPESGYDAHFFNTIRLSIPVMQRARF